MSGSGGKSAQTGLVDMGNIQFYDGFDPSNPGTPNYTPKTVSATETLPDLANFTGLFSEVVLNVTWAQLQPTPGVTGIDTTVIDDAITAVTNYNSTNGTHLGIKLRVWGGFTAPDWVQNLDGPALTVSGQASVDPGVFHDQTIGRYWTADYNDAWNILQTTLGNRYDGNSVIFGISQTTANATSDEPFVPFSTTAPKSSPTDTDLVNQPAQLVAGGYSDAAERLALRAGIANFASWSGTPLDFTMNNNYLFDGGSEHNDPNFTLAVLQQARNSTRIVQPGNHRLQSPVYTPDNFIYGQMATDSALDPSAASGSFQTASPDGLILLTGSITPTTPPTDYPDFPVTGSYAVWPYAMAVGVANHAGDVEFWDYSGNEPGFPVINGFLDLSLTQAQFLHDQLAAGTPPTTAAPLDGANLGFIAPAFVTGGAGTVAFSGTNAVLLASLAAHSSYSVTLTSTHGTLAVTDIWGIVSGPRSGPTITFSSDSLDKVNTVLASLTDTLASGTDIVHVSATDSDGDAAVRNVGLQVATPGGSSPSPSPGSGPAAFLGNGILAIGGVQSASPFTSGLQIGPGGTAITLLAALSPSAYSTASLTITGGAFEVLNGGTARFTGNLSAPTVTVDSGGAVVADGILTATGGTITNNHTIEAVADLTLGLQRLTLASDLAGTGTLAIDAGATLVVSGVVPSSQTINFLPNSIAQFANRAAASTTNPTQTSNPQYTTNRYSQSRLEMTTPDTMSGKITGFTFADALLLDGLSLSTSDLSYDGTTLTVNAPGGGTLNYLLSGDLSDLVPVVLATNSVGSTVGFVAPAAGVAPSVTAPLTLEGAAGVAVLVPDVVLRVPFPEALPSDLTVTVTLTATHGDLIVGTDDGFLAPTGNGTSSVTISGRFDQVERSLLALTYTAPAATASDSISISVADYGGTSPTPATITVSNNSPLSQFDWKSTAGGDFTDVSDWEAPGGGAVTTPPGGANLASFGAGTYTVTGDGAVGEILVLGTTTLTGHIAAQGLSGLALEVNSGGALTLAGGALVTAAEQATVGGTGAGLLALMGGALDLTGSASANALVLGQAAAGNGTVLDFEQITANGLVVVGRAGTGTLELRGVASSVTDGGADIGQLAGSHGSATVNGGEWTNSGTLIVGDAGVGALTINGMNNGIAGQVTAFDATIGNQAGGEGTVTLDGGELLVANVVVTSSTQHSTLAVGGAGTGTLTIGNGSEVAVGAAIGKPSNTSTTIYPNFGALNVGTGSGSGQVSISGNSALLVYGTATVGSLGTVTVGTTADDIALFAMMGTLTVDGTGKVLLGGANATLRAPTIDIDAGDLISGAGTVSGVGGGNQTTALATITNNGTIEAKGGKLLVYGDISGTGTLSVAENATLILEGAVGSGQTVALTHHTKLVIADPAAFHGKITGFDASCTLELGGAVASGISWAGDVLTIDYASGPLLYNMLGAFDNGFNFHADGLGGTNIHANLDDVGGGDGDVHMTTFSGLRYDFQATGDYVVVESTNPANPWEIQFRTIAAGGATSITEVLGTMAGSDHVTFAAGRDSVVHVDGTADDLRIGGVETLAGGTLARLDESVWRLDWAAGESMTVSSMGGWLDWTVSLGPNDPRGSMHGLLGSRTGRASDFQLRDGTVLGPLDEQQIMTFFADSWRVAPGQSLLDDALGRFVQAIAADAGGGGGLDGTMTHGGDAGTTDFLAVNNLNLRH